MGVIRSMARSIAKTNMKKKGMHKICKQGKNLDGKTWFAENWRYHVVGGKR